MDSSSESDSDIEFLIARISEQRKFNKRLKVETSELKGQCKTLQKFKKDMKYSSSDLKSNEMDIASNLLLFSSIQFGCNNSIKTQECVKTSIMENEHDDIYFPRHCTENMTFNSTSTCQGCGMEYKRYFGISEREFFIHCIRECPKYKELKLIKKCDKCQKLFLNRRTMDRHICNPLIPMYEGKQIALPNPSRIMLKDMFEIVPCKGCGKVFKKHKSGSKHYEKDYYVHCIRDCDEYKKLGLAKLCSGCDKWFLNQKAEASHKCSIPLEDRTNRDVTVVEGQVVARPEWMPRNIFKTAFYWSSKLKPKMCSGCKILIPEGYISKSRSSFKYYVHCIEECEGYKNLNLIRRCKQCKLKFLNPASLTKHLKNHRKNKV